ncbi:malonyl-ACP O-methyltransferase BioC [Teratosphaeria destructans]|uniref:Malonyl-ACP O-methyltransferase BioC n=1 Tax=Teratosphaeria destructans TaxID=418781 RepID=A0A9W7W544_9PEZI|nr:malonyl-ACP O-methyltransferase BioC [Teratosphaeria destructans]
MAFLLLVMHAPMGLGHQYGELVKDYGAEPCAIMGSAFAAILVSAVSFAYDRLRQDSSIIGLAMALGSFGFFSNLYQTALLSDLTEKVHQTHTTGGPVLRMSPIEIMELFSALGTSLGPWLAFAPAGTLSVLPICLSITILTEQLTRPPAISMVELAHQLSPLDGKSAKVLELGCGTGFLTMELAHRFPNTPILATDISEGMLEKVKRLGISSQVSLMQLDAVDLKPAEGKAPFTHILSTATIQFCSDPLRVIQEAYRVLAAFKARCSDPSQAFMLGIGSWNNADVERFYRAVYEELGIPEKFSAPFSSSTWPGDEAGVRQVFENVGFRHVKIKQLVLDDGRSEQESEFWHWEFENPGLVSMRQAAMKQFGLDKCKAAAAKVYALGREGRGSLGKRPEDSTLGQLQIVGCV